MLQGMLLKFFGDLEFRLEWDTGGAIAHQFNTAHQANTPDIANEWMIRVLFQPHRWSRFRDQWHAFGCCFDAAEDVVVSEVYSAGEKPMKDYSEARFAEEAMAHGHRSVRFLGSASDSASALAEQSQEGDLILVFGAGDIDRQIPFLCQQLEARL